MAFRFKKEQKPTPGFHAIDISNLPDPRAADRARAAEELHAAVRIQAGLRMLRARRTGQVLREAKAQRAAVTCLQSFARGAAARADLARRQQEARQQEAKQQLAAAIIQEHYRQTHPPEGGAVGRGGEAGSSSSAEGSEPLGDAFVIRNLDTGEAVSLELGAGDASGKDLKLSFGTLQQNPQAWEALKADSKGAPPPDLEPMRGRATPSPPPAAAQACWRSSRHRPRSPSARTSCACGRSDTCTPLTTRSATSTSLPTCSRRAARSRSRTHRSSLLVRARARLNPPHLPGRPGWAAAPASASRSQFDEGRARALPSLPPAQPVRGRAGPFDEQQFVVKCKGRAFTFMCDSVETRTKWIKNISMLAGCSASTEVCHKTTTMGH